MSDTGYLVYPPDFIGPILGYRCNPGEWAAHTLNKGDRCWFRHKVGKGFGRDCPLSDWKAGTFLMAYMYDGMIAKVYEDDPDDYIERSLFLGLGDELSSERPAGIITT